MNISINASNTDIDKSFKKTIKKTDNKYEIIIPNIELSLPIDNNFKKHYIFEVICEYKGHKNKYKIEFESVACKLCNKTNKFIINKNINSVYVTQSDDKIIWHTYGYEGDPNNKYQIEITDEPYCVYTGETNKWNLHLFFTIDEKKDTYEIWRVQDFVDLKKEDITYNKIYSFASDPFKDDNHTTYEEAKKEADRYIDYIRNSHIIDAIASYYDKLFIIKNGDNIETYEGDEYYDMRDLRRRHSRKIIKYNFNRDMCIGFVFIPFCIFLAVSVKFIYIWSYGVLHGEL